MVIVTAIGFCGGVVLLLYSILRRMGRAGGTLPVTAEWIGELSTDRYRPMMRLLDPADIEFLRSQPGFTPAMATRLRVQRCEIFLGYLRCLSADFKRVCAAVKILMLQSRRDRPDLAFVLLKNQAIFAWGICVIHVRVFLYRRGFCGVSVGQLIRSFETMRRELSTLIPAINSAAI